MKFSAKAIALSAIVALGSLAAAAQNSLPAPGSGGSFNPAPSGGAPGFGGGPGPGFGGGPGPGPGGPAWGSPWGPGSPGMWSPAPAAPAFQTGTTNVIAAGYDSYGRWRNLPLTVSYNYNGAFYDVEVINAWNPWADMWNENVDVTAYRTLYRGPYGTMYHFYAPLPTGTYYFNL